jgi:hypothetical protein
MIEAATRLAGGRGPISGSAGGGQGAHAAGAASQTQAGGPIGLESGATTDAAAMGASATPSAGAGARGGPAEHDTRSAEQIGSDFQTIYRQIEEVVKSSAEQETKAVGFGLR